MIRTINAEDHALWIRTCDTAIALMAKRGEPFQASDLLAAGLIWEPRNHHCWGPRFLAAKNAGVIVEVAAVKSKRRKTRSSKLTQWIAAPAVPTKEAA